MSTQDINIYESGSGGELTILNNDLVLSESLFQYVYIALFGGNVESSTLGNEKESQERFDYWANELIFKNDFSKQFNSETERILSNVAINSSGRLKIKSAVENDLVFIKEIIDLDVDVFILDTNTIEINVILKSTNQQNDSFQFIWDNAKKEVIIDKQI